MVLQIGYLISIIQKQLQSLAPSENTPGYVNKLRTVISNELTYIFYLLQYKGYSRDGILEWIEKIRNWGLDTSFIRNRALKKEELIAEIDSIIKSLN